MKHVPLRVRLVAALCLLVAVALSVTGFIATRSLHSYLQDRVDSQLQDAASHGPRHGPGFHAGDPDDDGDLAGAFYVQEFSSDGNPGTLESHPYATSVPLLSGLT